MEATKMSGIKVTRDDASTQFYLSRIEGMLKLLSESTHINATVYKKIIELAPADLASKLRLVPDNNLASRLCHLYAIYDVVASMKPIGDCVNYGVVSIEGSSKAIPVDCDLVVHDSDTQEFIYVDFTSSRDPTILEKKATVLKQNIKLNSLINTKWLVYTYLPFTIKVDIEPCFSSTEPGTSGLKLIDWLCRMDSKYLDHYISNCKEVYRRTCIELATLDHQSAPGDYKQTDITPELLEEALSVSRTQNDRKSLSFLFAAEKVSKSYFPYIDGIKELLMNANEYKPLFQVEAAEEFIDKDLIRNLANLSNDWLAAALHASCFTSNVVAVDDANVIQILPDFPPVSNKKLLSSDSPYKAAIQRVKGHTFKILFHPQHVDEKLFRSLKRLKNNKDKRYYKSNNAPNEADVSAYVNEAIESYTSHMNYFTSISLSEAKDTIWNKIQTISALASNDMDSFGRSTNSLLDAFIATVKQTYAGSSISHYYEICKTVLSSLKVSPSDNLYYVGTNGPYASVSIVKMSSTLDSFSTCSYCTIYKHERRPDPKNTRQKSTDTLGVSRTSFYTMNPNTLSYGLRVPYIWTSLATWELECNMNKGSISRGALIQILFDSCLTTLINRDQFAQAAEQVRYFYMSSIGYGGSAADIVDKTTFLRTRHNWEVLYMLRSYKLSASLSSVSSAGALKSLEDPSTNELMVTFPHSCYPVKSFSQAISSMYVCNIYNKFRAFHEISEAICYNEIIAERSIYEKRVEEDMYAVSGLSEFFFKIFKNSYESVVEYVISPDFVDQEVEFAVSRAGVKSNRYSGSAAFMCGATASNVDISSGLIDSIYSRLNRSPIEACSMRGSMSEGASVAEHQGIRAASSVLESVVRHLDLDPKQVNKGGLGPVYLMDAIEQQRPDFSILSCVIEQFNDSSIVYRYRIVQKDQKGHREISVLNFVFRIGALFVETITRELTSVVADTEIANNPNKDKIIEDTLASSFKRENVRNGVYCYDNSDQKRWGPNHNVNFFSYVLAPMLQRDPGLLRLTLRVFDLTMAKRAKYPESLIDLVMEKGITASTSKAIQEFLDTCLPKIESKIFEEVVAQGMCQGIYQQTSSLVHSIKTRAHTAVLTDIFPSVSMRFLATSDDAECVEFIPFKLNRISVVKATHTTGLRVGNLFNIVRSNPKSAFNFHIAELNSIFFKRGQMATPSLKQRIAKLDVGMGVNHVEDYLSCLASAANYLSAGGSYMGSVVVSILNLTMHTEQWLRWSSVKSDEYYKPVELGGFPVIEPLTTILSGGIGNFYQRAMGSVTPEQYSRLVTNSLLCPPEELSLEEFSRSGSERVKKSFAAKDLTIFKGTGPMGIFQLVKTDRKLSQFERRHGLSKWEIPDSFATLKKDSPLVKDFIFSLFRSTSVSTLETNLGVNSFFIRMAEPWVSYNRKCLKMSDHSPFKSSLAPDSQFLSHKELFENMSAMSITDTYFEMSKASRSSERKKEFEMLESQLTVRMRDSRSILQFLSEQEAGEFRTTATRPSIQRVTLRGHSAADSDSYLLSVMKTLSGEKSRPLINEFKHSALAYDSIDCIIPSKPLPLPTAIVLADNSVALYNKFIRKDTKMILPNKVENLIELCVDVMRNKFGENLGMVLQGSLSLDKERTRPYAHSKWYRDLLKYSAEYETDAANRAIRGESQPEPYAAVSSSRAILNRHDMFELTTTTSAEKTILIDSTSKDSFMSSIRSWMSAKVKFILSRETIASFVSGRLSFAHDYYSGNGVYYRFAKNKYFSVNASGTKALHMIKTSIREESGRRKTLYKHYFIFPEKVTGRTLAIEAAAAHSNEQWVIDIIREFSGKRIPAMGAEATIKKDRAASTINRRKTSWESDKVVFTCLTPGTELSVATKENSLCLMLTSNAVEFPVTYLDPMVVESLDIGYTLSHDDMKIGVAAYSKLQDITGRFNKARILSWPELKDALDFILVRSTTSTPDYIINKVLFKFIALELNSVQLDILRTFLVKDPEVGLGYSSSRFNQYLLNLGNRRNHDHSYFCKTATGERADLDSEDWDVQSAEEEILLAGKSNQVEFDDVESTTSLVIENKLLAAMDTSRVTLPPDVIDDWAEEVTNTVEESTAIFEENFTTAEEYNFDTESEGEDTEHAVTEHEMAMGSSVRNVQVASGSNSVESSPGGIKLSGPFADLLNSFDIDDIFDVDSESDTPASKVAGNDIIEDIFQKTLGGIYEKMKDTKDVTMKSEKSGHTVGGTAENSRSIIRFVKSWVDQVGSGVELSQPGDLTKNIASVTSIYIMFHKAGVLDMVNPLEKFYGMDKMKLPLDLSALAVIESIYG